MGILHHRKGKTSLNSLIVTFRGTKGKAVEPYTLVTSPHVLQVQDCVLRRYPLFVAVAVAMAAVA